MPGTKRRFEVANLSKPDLRDRCNTFASFSEDGFHFSWQAHHFGDLHRHFAWQAQHFRRVALHVFANTNVRAASSGDNAQNPWQAWQAWHVVTCDDTPHPTLYTPQSKLYTLHFTLHALHSTLPSTLHTVHSCALHSTLYTPHFAL